MKFIVLALAFVCVAQTVFGRPNAPSPSTSNIDDLVKNFNDAVQDASKKLLGDDVLNHMKQTADSLAGEANQLLKSLSEKTKELDPNVKQIVNNFQEEMAKHLDKLKKENPEVAQSAAKIQEELGSTVQKLIEESKKVQKSINDNSSGIVDDLKKLTKEAIDSATAKAKELQEKLTKNKDA